MDTTTKRELVFGKRLADWSCLDVANKTVDMIFETSEAMTGDPHREDTLDILAERGKEAVNKVTFWKTYHIIHKT